MKKHSLMCLLCLCMVATLLICGCDDDHTPTVITKAPGDVVMRTDATTTTTTTTNTTLSDTDNTGDPSTGNTIDGSGTVTTTPTIGDSTEVGWADGKAIAELAISLVGTPYAVGGNGPDSFDNPGFVTYCYKQFGYSVPRKAASMALYGEDVAPDELQVGDILVFCNEIGEAPGFCGIYIGNEQFVACNNPETPTKIQKLDSKYWGPRFVAARRPAAE